MILGPLRGALKDFKSINVSEEWKKELNVKVDKALSCAIDNVHWLVLPGFEADRFKFILESERISNFVGCMLFACTGCEERLLDLGSRALPIPKSSYLGELDVLV